MSKKRKRKKKVNSRIKKASDEWKEWLQSLSEKEKQLWSLFSKYIRLRGCLKTTGTITRGRCITCGRIYDFNKLQAGHFIPGRAKSILFNDKCVHGQCFRCNVVLGGNWPRYYRFMQKTYGQQTIEDLITASFIDTTFTEKWVDQSFEYYSWAVDYMRRNQQLVGEEIEAEKMY